LADAWALKASCDRVDGPAPESPERAPWYEDGVNDGVLRAEPSAIVDSLLAASNDRAPGGKSADELLRLVSPSSSL
jgi:hypothetical protein